MCTTSTLLVMFYGWLVRLQLLLLGAAMGMYLADPNGAYRILLIVVAWLTLVSALTRVRLVLTCHAIDSMTP